MTNEQMQLLAFNVRVEDILDALRAANANESPFRSRELSCAITNIEQGSHWLTARIAALDES